MPEPWLEDLSKGGQLARSPGKENRLCPDTGSVIRDCECWKHRGARNRRKGQVKQRQARKRLEKAFGVPAGRTQASTANEETWRLPVRIEVKSGYVAAPVGTFYRNTRIQAEKDHAIGDIRPFLAVAQVDGSSDGLAVVRMSDLIQLFDQARTVNEGNK